MALSNLSPSSEKQANGTAKRAAALDMIYRQNSGSERRITLGTDKGYDTSDFFADLRQKCVTPHVAQKVKASAIDARTTRHTGYVVSQQKRKRVEEPFGWAKTTAGIAKIKVHGLARVRRAFTFAMANYNLIRNAGLFSQAA